MIERISKELANMDAFELNGASRYQVQHRAEQLYHMHELMRAANDEGLYMNWIYLFPDNPTMYDFIEVALDDELFNDCYNLFLRIICHKDYM